MAKQRILVTGGAGFVGSNVAIGLKERYEDSQVVAFDNLKRRGSELNIRRLDEHGVTFVHGDIRNNEDFAAVGRVTAIVECAAEPSTIAGYGGSPEYVINANLIGTVNCLEFARRHGASFIFVSTNRVYPVDKINKIAFRETDTRFMISDRQKLRGVSRYGVSEEFLLDGPRSFYGATKLASELMLQEYIYGYKLKGVINRCSIIAGPWQMGTVEQGCISLWVASHVFKTRLNYIGFNGSGKQLRDVLHISDLIDLLDKELRAINRINGEVFNIGGGIQNALSLFELTGMCRKITGNTLKIDKIKDNRKADIRIYVSDVSKAKRVLNWKPRYSVGVTLEDIHNWIVDNHDSLRQIFVTNPLVKHFLI